jgi:hypothetical protein
MGCLASPLCNFKTEFGWACLRAGHDSGGVNGSRSIHGSSGRVWASSLRFQLARSIDGV